MTAPAGTGLRLGAEFAELPAGFALNVGTDDCFDQVRPQVARDAAQVLHLAEQALRHAEGLGLEPEAVRALLVAGMAHDALGQAERDEVFAQALRRAEALADPILLVRAANSQIVSDIYHGRYADALARGQAMLGVAHVLQRNDLLGRLLHNLGTALSLIGEFELAISMHDERLRLITGDDAELRTQRARTINNMAMAWLGLARAQADAAAPGIRHRALRRARTQAEAACSQLLEGENLSMRMSALDTVVAVLLESGEIEAAGHWVERVEQASPEALAQGTELWGSFALAQSRVDLARPESDSGLLLQRLRAIEALPGTKFRSGEMHAMLTLCLAHALARVDAYQEALAYHRRWLQFEARTQSLLAREHAMAVHHTLDSLRGETEEFITHDLRNPLGAAMVQMESLATDTWPAERRAGLAAARAAVQRVLDTADHYLTIVRTRHLRRSELASIDLAELVDDVGERLAPPAQAQVRLERELEWGLVVRGDRICLLMALTRLLRNALRHAPARTAVVWRLAAQGPFAVLTVSNDGPGLGLPMRRRLLAHADGSGSRHGRGLIMIARVAQLHDALIEVGDQPTHITLRFPLAEPEGPGGV